MMNDDFLHRLRKTPSPEFLRGLKTRLDRQRPLPVRPRRLSFSRGLVVGLLLGSTAFAITSLSINPAPTSFQAFLRAPVQLLTQTGSGSSQSEGRQHHGPVPFGPAWLPNHVVPRSPGETYDSAPSDASALATSPASATVRAPVTPLPNPSPWFETLTVVASPDAYPHALSVAENFGRGFGQMKVSLAKGGTAFESLCNPDSKGSPDIAEVSRRVTPAELRTCAVGIMELKIGHQALLLARGRLYGPLKLSARDLFLALARRIPNPAGPQELIDNPNTTWNQVDGALPYDRIHILAPVLDPADGKLTAALLLEAGCNTYPWIADLRTSDATRYEEICRSLRSDGAYEESADTGWAFSESLVRDPTALGIFTVRGFEGYKDKLIANAIDGIEPTLESVAAETYPASRSLYLYVNKRHASGNFVFDRLIGAFLSPFNSYGVANGWALVSLDAAERTEVQASLKRF